MNAQDDRIVSRHLPATRESAGLAGSYRGFSSLVPIVI
jgi:hypothetical protein